MQNEKVASQQFWLVYQISKQEHFEIRKKDLNLLDEFWLHFNNYLYAQLQKKRTTYSVYVFTVVKNLNRR